MKKLCLLLLFMSVVSWSLAQTTWKFEGGSVPFYINGTGVYNVSTGGKTLSFTFPSPATNTYWRGKDNKVDDRLGLNMINGSVGQNLTVRFTDDSHFSLNSFFLRVFFAGTYTVKGFRGETNVATLNLDATVLPELAGSFAYKNFSQNFIAANPAFGDITKVEISSSNGLDIFIDDFTFSAPLPTATITSQTNNGCHGDANGSATVSVSGGTGPYTYSWSPSGSTGATASGLSAGTHTVTVTDANGVTATASVAITQPAPVAGTAVVTNVSCFGGSNGRIDLTPSGGIGPYTFDWGGGITNEDRSLLAAGSYMVTIRDDNGCEGTVNVTVGQPASALSATASQTSTPAYGTSTGTASVSPSGGTAPYTYSWSPSGGTGATASGLAAGNYSCIVTDDNGCSTVATVTIIQAAASTNNDLSNLTVNSGTLSPGFSPGNTNYTSIVSSANSTVNITPTIADATAILTVNGTAHSSGNPKTISLNYGVNTITIVVTAQSGGTKTYTLQIEREMVPPGNALGFDGSQKIDLAAAATAATNFGGSSSFTIEAWVNPATFSGRPTIFGHKLYGHPYDGYALFFLDAGHLYLEGKSTGAGSTVAVKAGRWNHIAVVFEIGSGNSGRANFYVNGVAAGSGTLTIPSSLAAAVIGNFSDSGQPFKGRIDELKIWNTVRTQAEIKSGMTSIINPASAGLVAYYKFDQGTAAANNAGVTTLQDKTANNYDGTLSGFALTGTSSNWLESYAMVVPVTTTATAVSSTGFTANWTAAALGTVDKYLLDVAADAAFTSKLSAYDGKDVGAATSEVITGLAPGKIYYYRIYADKPSVTGQGSYSNATSVTTSPIAGLGTALTVERSRSEGVEVANRASLNFGTGSFTVEAWVRRTADAGHATVVGKQSNATTTGYYLRVTNNKLSFAVGTYPNSTWVDGVKTIDDGNWHHVAAVMDATGKNMSLYVDGVLDASKPFTVNYTGDNAVLFGIGFKPGFGEYFNGSLDEIRIWNTARTVDQIKEYMNAPLAGTESGLVSYWSFEDGNGTSVDDRSSNINTGTLQNPDGDEFGSGSIAYAASLNEDTPLALRLGGTDATNQAAATAVIASLPANGKLYQTNDGITRGVQITAISTALNDNRGNPRRVLYEPNVNFNGSESFTYNVTNGTSSSYNTETVTLTVASLNDAPVLTLALNATTFTEGDAAKLLATPLEVSDSDNSTLSSAIVAITANYQAGADKLHFTNDGSTMGNIAANFNPATGVLTLTSSGATATLAQWQAALRTITFNNTSDDPSTANRTVSFTVNDGSFTSTAVTWIVTVGALNDTPLVSATAINPTFTEDGNAVAVFSSASVNPVEASQKLKQIWFRVSNYADGGDERLIVDGSEITLTNNNTITTAGLGLTANVLVSGTGASVFVSKTTGITGAEMEGVINGVLYKNISRNPNATARGVTLEFVEDDGGGSDAGRNMILTSTVTMTAVNDVPTVIAPAMAVTNMNISAVFNTVNSNLISITDVDAGSNASQITLTATNGTISLSEIAGLTFTAGDGTADAVMTFTGTLSAINTALNGLTFAPTALFVGTAFLQVAVSDQGYSGTGGSLSDTENISITVNSVPPVVTGISSTTANGTYKIGDNIAVTINFDQAIAVTGAPKLSLETGTTDRAAVYASGSGTNTLVFDYTVQTGDLSADLDHGGTTALSLNAGTIKNASGDDAVLTLPAPGSGTSLAGQKALVIDGIVPSLSGISVRSNNVTSTLAKPGDAITVTFTASETIMSPSVTIAGHAATVTNVSGNTWKGVYTMAGTDTEGTLSYSISFTDGAGNNGTAMTSGIASVIFDKTAPAIPANFAAASGDTQISLSWDANTDPDIRTYRILSGTTGSPSAQLIDIAAGTSAYVNASLTNGMMYYYAIQAIDAAGNISAASSDITSVPRADQTINFAAVAAKTYGDASFTIGPANSSAGFAVTYTAADPSVVSISGNSATILAAGSTAITASQGGSAAYNAAPEVIQTLTVGKKALTVVNASRSKIYGDVLADADFTGSLTGVVVGDDITITRSSIGGGAAASAGTYPIAATLADPDNKLGNYTVTNTSGQLTITRKALTITATGRTKVYGETVSFTGNEFSSSGLINGDTVTSMTLSSTGAAATATVADSYPIVASAATGNDLSNYNISYVNGALTVTKKVLTITAHNKQRFAGTANPQLTVSYSGFVNGEDVSVLSLLPSVSTTATTASPQGDYLINASAAAADNYDITYVDGILKVVPGAPTNVSLAGVTLFENHPAGTTAGILSSTSDDPNATFTYALASGSGDRDNGLFAISGDKLQTTGSLNFEQKSIYSIRVRSTTQHGFSLDKVFTIALSDVNEVPTLSALTDETICYTTAPMTVQTSGVSSGPEGSLQSTVLSVSSDNDDLFEQLAINNAGVLTYQAKNGRSGKATVTVTVTDNGGIANGGTDTFSRNFTITVNPLPVITIASDKGTSISKGDVVRLTATGGATYSWTNPGGLISGQQSATVTIRPEKTATYRVAVTTAAGCVSEQEMTIEVKEDYQMLSQTNIVTPNGDGVNDSFVIRNIDMFPNNTVKIYDGAGRLLYNTTRYTNEWDGTFQGSPLAEGTYYYVVDFGNGKPVLKGFITVVRD